MFRQATATARPDLFARVRARTGSLGLQTAQICCLVLVLALVWGSRWPFYRFGLTAPHFGILDANFDPADFLLLGIVAGWGLALVSGQDRLELSPRWISGPLLLFVFAGGLATVGAISQAAALRFTTRSVGLVLLYLYLHRSISARRLAPATLALWLVPGLALNGLLAIAQTIHQQSLGLAWLGEPGWSPTTPGLPVVLVHGTRLVRAFGLLPHANVLGGLLAAALPFVVSLLWQPEAFDGESKAWRPRRVLRDVLLLLSVALLVAGIMLSFSRSAWLGLLCGGLYLIVRRVTGYRAAVRGPGTRRAVLVVASIGLVAAGLLLVEWDAVSVRLQPTSNRLEQTSIEQRLSLLDLSFKVIALRPLTGVGGDNYPLAADRFLPPDQQAQSSNYPVHNTYLMAQAELGVLGAAAWLALMLAPLLGLVFVAPRRRPARPISRGSLDEQHEASTWMRWQGAAGCSLTVVAVVGLFDWYIWGNGPGNEPVAVLWIIALALFAASLGEPRALYQSTHRRVYPFLIVAIPVAVLAVAVGGFDYLYRDRALPRVIVNTVHIDVGGQTQDAIALQLRPFSITQRFRIIALHAEGQASILIPAYKLGYRIDHGLTAWRAFNVGHGGSLPYRLVQQAQTLMNGTTVNMAQRVDENALRTYLFKLQGVVNRAARPGRPGRALDVARAQRQITHLLLHTTGAFGVFLPFVSRPALPVSRTAVNHERTRLQCRTLTAMCNRGRI